MPQLNNKDKGGLTLKVSEKGGVSLYGMGRFRSRTKKNTDSAACRSHVFGTVSAIAAICYASIAQFPVTIAVPSFHESRCARDSPAT
jgi:hypothetical protein